MQHQKWITECVDSVDLHIWYITLFQQSDDFGRALLDDAVCLFFAMTFLTKGMYTDIDDQVSKNHHVDETDWKKRGMPH